MHVLKHHQTTNKPYDGLCLTSTANLQVLHHPLLQALHLQHGRLGRVGSQTLNRLSLEAAEPTLNPMSGLLPLLETDRHVELRLQAFPDLVAVPVLTGDVPHGAVGARSVSRPASERVDDVPLSLTLFPTEILGAVATVLIPSVRQAHQGGELVVLVVLLLGAYVAAAALHRVRRRVLCRRQGDEGREEQKLTHLGAEEATRRGLVWRAVRRWLIWGG